MAYNCTKCQQVFMPAGPAPGTPPAMPPAPGTYGAPTPGMPGMPGGPGMPGFPGPRPESNGMGIAALVCGILGFLIVPALVAIALGAIALGSQKSGKTGKTTGLIGLILGLLMLVGIVPFVLYPSLNRARETANRVKCASNMRQIGQAMLLYANGERNGSYPRGMYVRDGSVITDTTGWASNDTFAAPVGTNNVGAALFLLLRTQDISSEVFVCPSTDCERDNFGGGTNTAMNRCNFTDLKKNLSYSVQNMYADTTATSTGFRWNNSLSPDFVVLADRNPGAAGSKGNVFAPAGSTDTVRNQRLANSHNHGEDGQNILLGDGRVEFVTNPWVGVSKDNIYTRTGSRQLGPNWSPADANDSILLPTDAPDGKH